MCNLVCGSDLHAYLTPTAWYASSKPDPLTGEVAPVTLGHEYVAGHAVPSTFSHYHIGSLVLSLIWAKELTSRNGKLDRMS
jgi:(R,R)-butanediol dehydrogenase / meso-butanediol dehydrogenase / diacetyl reductase